MISCKLPLLLLLFDDTYHSETARVYMMHTMQSTPHRKHTELSALRTTQDSMPSSQPRLQELRSDKLSTIRPPMTGGMRNDLSLIPAFKQMYFWLQWTSLVVDECTPLLVLGSGNSSVVKAPDSLKGCRFESLQEQQENFILQGQLSVLTFYFSIRSTPCYRSSM